MSENYKRMDKRTMDRYREKGQLTDKDIAGHLKGLPDDEANAQWVQMDLHDAEISEEGKTDDEADDAEDA